MSKTEDSLTRIQRGSNLGERQGFPSFELVVAFGLRARASWNSMIDIFKEKSGSSLVVRICGAIDETVDFDKLLGPPPPEFRIISKDVTRINSNGVKAWIKYFRSAQKAGTKITFAECATSIVEQINLVSNFVCGGTVESIYLPYSCFSCRNEFVGLAQVTDLKAGVDRFKVFKCPSCAGEARFDEIAAEYFAFLKRSP